MRPSTVLTASALCISASFAAPIISEEGAALIERDPALKLPHIPAGIPSSGLKVGELGLQLGQLFNLTRRAIELLERDPDFNFPQLPPDAVGPSPPASESEQLRQSFNFPSRDLELLERDPKFKLPKLTPGAIGSAAQGVGLGLQVGQLLNLTRRDLELLSARGLKIPKLPSGSGGDFVKGGELGLQLGQVFNLTRREAELLERESKFKLPNLKLPPGAAGKAADSAGLALQLGQLFGSGDDSANDGSDGSAADSNTTDTTQKRRHHARRALLKSRMEARQLNALD